MTRFASFDARERRRGGSALVTGTEVTPQQGGASCVVTTDSESPRLLRQNSHVQSIELRTHVFIDSLQPQLAAYMGSVSQGFLPIPGDACLWMEVSPGMAVHRVTDIALKASNVRLGQMVVERAFGSMALYHRDQSTVLHSGDVVLEAIGSLDAGQNPYLQDPSQRLPLRVPVACGTGCVCTKGPLRSDSSNFAASWVRTCPLVVPPVLRRSQLRPVD